MAADILGIVICPQFDKVPEFRRVDH